MFNWVLNAPLYFDHSPIIFPWTFSPSSEDRASSTKGTPLAIAPLSFCDDSPRNMRNRFSELPMFDDDIKISKALLPKASFKVGTPLRNLRENE